MIKECKDLVDKFYYHPPITKYYTIKLRKDLYEELFNEFWLNFPFQIMIESNYGIRIKNVVFISK